EQESSFFLVQRRPGGVKAPMALEPDGGGVPCLRLVSVTEKRGDRLPCPPLRSSIRMAGGSIQVIFNRFAIGPGAHGLKSEAVRCVTAGSQVAGDGAD